MAKITTKDESRIYRIRRFLGLHESADGDTQLELGEASELRNWQVTPQFHLRVRPGYRTAQTFSGPVRGMWTGYVSGRRCTLCVADGGIWELGDSLRRIGDISDAPTTMFGFGNKVYFLNGQEYLVWDGAGFADTVEGYVPLVVTAMTPAGDGVTVENVNRLTGRRRCRFSADGKAVRYHLPEQNLLAVEKVTVDEQEVRNWTAELSSGTVEFSAPPETGDCNVEVTYAVANDLRVQVESMRFAEQFNGAADTRVFLYGDGSAKAIYCGVTEDGTASAEYFPDLYEVLVGSENAPLTAMIKYYDRLISYKADGGAFSTRYELTTLADGTAVPGFLTVSINREIGNSAMGQVRLVQNVPRTLYGGNPYDKNVQSQPWLMITLRKPLEEVRRMAEKNGFDPASIRSDQEQGGSAMERLSQGKVTLLVYFQKDPETGHIWAGKYTQSGPVEKFRDTGLKLYPVTWMNWDYVQDCYHGHALISQLIPNQVFVNQLFAMVMRSLQTTAFPKVIYDRTRIPRWDGGVGRAIGVNGGGDLSSIAKIMDPASVSPQISQFIDAAINYTQNFMGSTDAALGDVRPENTSAILALQRASNAPLELVKQNLYQAVEDLGRIYLDMMSVYYGTRWVQGADGMGMELDFTLLRNLPLTLRLDVGASSYWSEIAAVQTLDNLLAQDKITLDEYLERIPDGYISKKQELIEKCKIAERKEQEHGQFEQYR